MKAKKGYDGQLRTVVDLYLCERAKSAFLGYANEKKTNEK